MFRSTANNLLKSGSGSRAAGVTGIRYKNVEDMKSKEYIRVSPFATLDKNLPT